MSVPLKITNAFVGEEYLIVVQMMGSLRVRYRFPDMVTKANEHGLYGQGRYCTALLLVSNIALAKLDCHYLENNSYVGSCSANAVAIDQINHVCPYFNVLLLRRANINPHSC